MEQQWIASRRVDVGFTRESTLASNRPLRVVLLDLLFRCSLSYSEEMRQELRNWDDDFLQMMRGRFSLSLSLIVLSVQLFFVPNLAD